MRNADDRWPNLFIIGAPRSGTTTLHNWLDQHPEIFMSSIKEPHYFSDIDFPNIEKEVLQVTREKENYLSLFDGSEKAIIRGESSSHYLIDPSTAKYIHNTVPYAKIIVILRDPIQRAYSHYLLYGRRGKQPDFLNVIQYCLGRYPPYNNLMYNLVDMGYYYRHLQRYFEYFPTKQIFVIPFHKLQDDPEEVLRTICSFLEVDQKEVANMNTEQASNQYMQPANPFFDKLLSSKALTNIGLRVLPRPLLRKIRYGFLLKKGDKPDLNLEARCLLTQAYESDMIKLEELLGEEYSSLKESFVKKHK